MPKFGVAPGIPMGGVLRPPPGASYSVNWDNPITRDLIFFASWLNTGNDLAIDLVRGRRSVRTSTQTTRKSVSDPEFGQVFEWGSGSESGSGGAIVDWGNIPEWNGKSQASLAVWLKVMSDASSTEILFGTQDAGASYEGFNFETWINGMRNAEASPDDNYIGLETTGTGLTDKWELLVSVYDGSKTADSDQLKFYQNAKPLSGTWGSIPTAMGTFTSVWNLYAGNFQTEYLHFRAVYFAGWLRPLSPQEIWNLWAPDSRFDIYKFNDPKFFLLPLPQNKIVVMP